MHPAFSVIFLTTLIGAGQGLFVALYATQVASTLHWLAPQGPAFYTWGTLVVLAFLGFGLGASFLHLGRPERAWRAAAMWRTSWLSREVIVLPAFMTAVFAYGLLHHFGYRGTLLSGAVGAMLCFVLFLCTGMIYACIKFLQEWASPWTVVNFITLGCASGFTLAAVYALIAAPRLADVYSGAAIVLTLIAFCTRGASLLRNARIRPRSTIQSAIGIKHPKIAQKSQGFIGGSFNTREFFHNRPENVVRTVKRSFLLLVFALPIVLLTAGIAADAPVLIVTAFLAQYAGLIAERWFFFAEARHPQNLYYQTMS